MEEYAKTNNLTYTEDPNFDVSEYIFGAKYRASETMPEWFAKQTPEVQAAFYNAEKAIDEVLEVFSEMMGIEKRTSRNIAHGEEVYADLGITMKENTRTAEELRRMVLRCAKTQTGHLSHLRIMRKNRQKCRRNSSLWHFGRWQMHL